MQTFPVWTWSGQHFGNFEGEYLWTYEGKNVGRLRGEFIYAPDGRYLGEVRNGNRLLTSTSRKSTSSLTFNPKPDRPGIARHEDKEGAVMYIGYEDFPPPSAFST